MVFPLFLFVMLAVLQYANVMGAAVRFGTALTETGKSMAVTAYISRYGQDAGTAEGIAAGALSAAYAQSSVMKKAGKPSSVKNASMALSSFLKEEDMIDLVLTYQIRSPFGFLRLPGNIFLQKAKVRAWTGRLESSEGGASGDGESAYDWVYVAETGTVYHDDPDCTHLRLSIRAVDVEALQTLRNNDGEIYRQCERCTGGYISSTVYITEEGNRYHGSLGCSGLKRTVREVHRDDTGELRACSKCGNH